MSILRNVALAGTIHNRDRTVTIEIGQARDLCPLWLAPMAETGTAASDLKQMFVLRIRWHRVLRAYAVLLYASRVGPIGRHATVSAKKLFGRCR